VAREPIDFAPRATTMIIVAGAMDAWLRGEVSRDPQTALLQLEAAGLHDLKLLPSQSVRADARRYLQELVGYRSIYGSLAPTKASLAKGGAWAQVRVSLSQSADEPTRRDPASDALLRAIAGAHRRILVQSPYLLLTRPVIAELIRASERGVRIDMITNSPGSSDNFASQALFVDSWPELEARIPTLRVFVANDYQMQHVKRAVFDDDLSLVGSYNLDPLSAHLNSEMVVELWSRELTERNADEIQARLESGDVLEYRIKRTADGRAVRFPPGDQHAGEVEVEFGPHDHLDPATLESLENMKSFLFSIRGIWSFEVVAW
jgi:putative cardiolipin synthase